MPKYALVVVLTHILERPLPSQEQAQAGPVGSIRLHPITKLPLPSQGQAVRSDLSVRLCLESSEQVAPTELTRGGAIYYKQVAPPGLKEADLWVKTRSPNGTKSPNTRQNPFR